MGGCASVSHRAGTVSGSIPRTQQDLKDPNDPSIRVNIMGVTPEDTARAEAIKQDANALFKKGKFSAAIDMYTEAITLAPNLSVLYINRALCFKKLEIWAKCEADSRRALELNSSLTKGHYCLGLALRHRGEFGAAVRSLERALDYAREAGDTIKDDIWRELAACKYQAWQHDADTRKTERARMQARINKFMDAYYKSNSWDDSRASDERDLEALFGRAFGNDDHETDNAYTCVLTMEPFREPVCTPDGHSYERAALLDHLQKVGKFDPISRTDLEASQLIPNFRLRTATKQYLDEHPWTWKECMNPTY